MKRENNQQKRIFQNEKGLYLICCNEETDKGDPEDVDNNLENWRNMDI